MRVGIGLAAVMMMVATAAVAQAPAKQEAAPQAVLVPAPQAKLQIVVGEGLFDLRFGQSVDLTKNQTLLTSRRDREQRGIEQGTVYLTIAGVQYDMTVGQRLDLKQWGPTQKDVKDKDKCVLDLIDVVAPKGAPAQATFRFSCL